MSFLTPKLRHRIQIRQADQTGNDFGGFDRSYTTLTTIWAGINALKTEFREFVEIIRGQSLDLAPTHEIVVREIAVRNLGISYGKGFDTGFDSIADLNPLKSDYFIFLEEGSAVKGRLFKIMKILRDEVRREYIRFRVMEIEEHGTGWPE